MSQAEDLLNNLSESVPVHDHVVEDPDSYFVIDPDTRQIGNISRTLNVIMQYDHDSEVYTFELQRIVEGHDMTLCNVVKVHYNNIDGTTGAENADVFDLYDLHVNPDNEDTVICSWRISRKATQLAGTLSFLLQYLCYASDGETVTYEWHTDIYSDVEVRPGRNNGPQAIINHTDILEQWRSKLFGLSNSEQTKITELSVSEQAKISELSESVQSDITALKESSTQEIINKGAETLETIPTDYTDLYNIAKSNERRKANAIVCKAEGSSVVVQDSSDDYVRGLRVFGRSEQRTTTGAQLYDIANQPTNEYCTVDEDSITIMGKGAWSQSPVFSVDVISNKTVYLSTESITGGNKAKIILQYYDTNNNGITLCSVDNTTKKTNCIVPDGVTNLRLIHIANASNTELEERTTAIFTKTMVSYSDTSWEPYTGGQASPNPSYPQEIVSLGEMYNYAEVNNILGGTVNTANFSEPYDGTVTVAIKTTDGTSQVNCSFEYAGGTTGGDIGVIGTGNTNNRWYYKVIEPTKPIVGVRIYNTDSSNKRTSEKILIRKGSYHYATDYDYRPYTGVREIGVEVYGNQLFDISDKYENFRADDDDWITVTIDNTNGTTIKYASVNVNPSKILKPNTKYLGVLEIASNGGLGVEAITSYEGSIKGQFKENIIVNDNSVGIFVKEITTRDDFTGCMTMLRTVISAQIGISATAKFRLSILADTSITANTFVYEPFTEQSLILQTPNGLPAIPTTNSSLATYTDADGKMWVSDEIDLERGKYVSNLRAYTLIPTSYYKKNENRNTTEYIFSIGTSAKATKCMCSVLGIYGFHRTDIRHFYADNNAFHLFILHDEVAAFESLKSFSILYVRTSPIETDLSASEIAQYQALHTNYPATTLLNDADAHMILEYNADTKTYIDNKFAELQAAILNNAT